MENNFYLGTLINKRKNNVEKLVLYSKDNYNYIDLINERSYTTDQSKVKYICEDSIIKVNIETFKPDYLYLLTRYNSFKSKTKRRLFKR